MRGWAASLQLGTDGDDYSYCSRMHSGALFLWEGIPQLTVVPFSVVDCTQPYRFSNFLTGAKLVTNTLLSRLGNSNLTMSHMSNELRGNLCGVCVCVCLCVFKGTVVETIHIRWHIAWLTALPFNRCASLLQQHSHNTAETQATSPIPHSQGLSTVASRTAPNEKA